MHTKKTSVSINSFSSKVLWLYLQNVEDFCIFIRGFLEIPANLRTNFSSCIYPMFHQVAE